MTYQEAKAERDRLETAWKAACLKVREIDGVGSGRMGMTPDAIKALPEYKEGRAECQRTFVALQTFNAAFVKRFAAERRAETKGV